MFGRGTTDNEVDGAEALRLESVRKVYGSDDNPVAALNGVSLSLPAGSFTAVMGPSGSGKSTLLQCAAGLESPTEGQVFVDGTPMTGGSETKLTKFRRSRIGFIFQHFNLLPTLTVLQNVTLPLRLAGKKIDRRAAVDVLGRVGLGNRLDHLPSQLSGGQQQRVAIARALVTRLYGQTLVMVTHDPVAASYAGSVLFLADGQMVGHLANPTAAQVAERMTHLAEEVERRRVREGV